MFTLQQIKAVHSKVRTGADFPQYIQEMKRLGVIHYETFVTDGHNIYYGEGNELTSEPKYQPMAITDTVAPEQFKRDLVKHQHGGSDYLQFCEGCAATGVEKWVVCLETMTCTYFDKSGSKVLVEAIPAVKR